MHAPAPFDPGQFKNATRTQWDSSAKSWNDSGAKIRVWLRSSTDAMLDGAHVKSGAHVLDVAAGAGDQTLDVAARVGAGGHVLATDISPGILEFARANARQAGFDNIDTQTADGENLGVAPGRFDAVICRLGLMFFPDPLKGLHEMHHALKPGGWACTLVFSAPERNPCIGIIMSTALKHAGLPPRDPYRPGGLLSLGKPGLIDDLFRRAGFSEIRTTAIQAPFALPSVKDYIDFTRSSAAPVLQILAALDDKAQNAAWAEIEDKLGAFNGDGGWVGPNELLLTSGQR